MRVLRGETGRRRALQADHRPRAIDRDRARSRGLLLRVGLYSLRDIAPTAAGLLLLPAAGRRQKEGLARLRRARRPLCRGSRLPLHLVYLCTSTIRSAPRIHPRGRQHSPCQPLARPAQGGIKTLPSDLTASAILAQYCRWHASRRQRARSGRSPRPPRLARQLDAAETARGRASHCVIARSLLPVCRSPRPPSDRQATTAGRARRAWRPTHRDRGAPPDESLHVRTRRGGAAAPPNARHADAYRLSLSGWRRLEDTALAPPARAGIDRVNADEPSRLSFAACSRRARTTPVRGAVRAGVRNARPAPRASRAPTRAAAARARRPPRRGDHRYAPPRRCSRRRETRNAAAARWPARK